MSLADKVVLVTGASRGIGKAIAIRLGKAGARVTGTATTEAGASAITAYLQEQGLQGQGRVMDISQVSSIEATITEMSQNEGAPSILINNAGITADNLFIRMKDEEWSRVIQTNLTGTYHVIQACIRSMMKARYGRIVNISSVVGSIGNAGQANYAAAKAGLYGLSKSLARELGSRNITVNTVAPGFIDTDMTRDLASEHRTKLLEQVPLARMGVPDDIAEAVLFLVNHGNYITGETLHVNGGMFMA
jgi:3-oxoacyl-[acyl-carrier protein] reductase